MIPAVRIERVAAGGDGVGHLADGRVVFIPATAPGDLVEPRELRLSARFARAWPGQVVESGPGRVDPPCHHLREDGCGGCQLQHLAETAQQEVRKRIVGDALRRIGKLVVEDPPLRAAESPWGYRTRITLHRTETGTFGFHRAECPGEVFPLRRCLIAREELNGLWEELSPLAATLPPTVTHMTLRVDAGGGLHCVLHGAHPGSADLAPLIAMRRELASRGREASFWYGARGGESVLVAGNATGGQSSAMVFEQVHPAMAESIRRWVMDRLAPKAGSRWWDLYAGAGEMTDRLARRGAEVESVERDRAAVVLASRSPMPGVRRHAGTVEEWIPRLTRPDGVLVNPPRTGLTPRVSAGVVASGVRRVGYISCDPATLARDLKILGDHYALSSVQAFDLFPQTAHVEVAAILERR